MKYDLEGICQDCMYLEKIKPLFKEKDKEIERLNNIISGLEKYLFNDLQEYGGGGYVQEIYDKLKELKENNK